MNPVESSNVHDQQVEVGWLKIRYNYVGVFN